MKTDDNPIKTRPETKVSSTNKRGIWNVTDEEWRDWRWQMRNRITTIDALKQLIELTPEEEEGIRFVAQQDSLPLSITPFFAMLMDPVDCDCPIRKQVVCRIEESRDSVFD
ncbi:MAG: hypothetical protein Q8Q33_04510, partial [Chlamydiota bacterium]|nr:hypothetical protein [Chlamydiota bacterium]